MKIYTFFTSKACVTWITLLNRTTKVYSLHRTKKFCHLALDWKLQEVLWFGKCFVSSVWVFGRIEMNPMVIQTDQKRPLAKIPISRQWSLKNLLPRSSFAYSCCKGAKCLTKLSQEIMFICLFCELQFVGVDLEGKWGKLSGKLRLPKECTNQCEQVGLWLQNGHQLVTRTAFFSDTRNISFKLQPKCQSKVNCMKTEIKTKRLKVKKFSVAKDM